MKTNKFKMIPETLLLDERVTKNDLLVYCGLLQFKNNKTKKAFPSLATLGKVSRLSKNPIKTALKHLEELGYIKITRRFDKVTNSYTSNMYTLLDVSEVDINSLYEKSNIVEEEVEEEVVESKPVPKKKAPKRVEKVAEEEDNRPMHDRALERIAEDTDKALEKLFSDNNCIDYEEYVNGLEEEVEDEYVEWYNHLDEGVRAEYDRIIGEAIVEEGIICLNTKIESDLGKRLTRSDLMSIVNFSPNDYTPILEGIAITKARLSSVVDLVSYLRTVVKGEVAKTRREVI